jgi:predicted homoserine dehydrogenase-like protein
VKDRRHARRHRLAGAGAHPAIDVIVECTGHPIAAVDHCLEAFAHGKHVVNVTVEADAFCGPLLARKAAEAGVIYSLASATSRR